MCNLPSGDDLFLVVVTPSPRDLEIARLLGWYRIPLRYAPKIISVDFLAFYQTGSFPVENRWKVEFIAPVRGHELTTRKELIHDEPDHPHAEEEYYKIILGPLQRLPKPIESGKWKRFTFIYSNGKQFNQANTLANLAIRTEERPLFWRTLRERALKSGAYSTVELPEILMDESLLAILASGLNIKEGQAWYDSDG